VGKSAVRPKRFAGDERDGVNSARVAFGKESEWEWADFETQAEADDFALNTPGAEVDWDYMVSDRWMGNHPVRYMKDGDVRLIRYLARGCPADELEALVEALAEDPGYIKEEMIGFRNRGLHWTPFAQVGARFHIKAPIFVWRQLDKHQVGFVKSEISRRYVTTDPEFYKPDVWRSKAPNVKQGSGEAAYTHFELDGDMESIQEITSLSSEACSIIYQALIDGNVCPEQARMVLPQSMMTESIVNGSLLAWSRLYLQRMDSHAQKETRDIAEMIGSHLERAFPVSWKALIGEF